MLSASSLADQPPGYPPGYTIQLTGTGTSADNTPLTLTWTDAAQYVMPNSPGWQTTTDDQTAVLYMEITDPAAQTAQLFLQPTTPGDTIDYAYWTGTFSNDFSTIAWNPTGTGVGYQGTTYAQGTLATDSTAWPPPPPPPPPTPPTPTHGPNQHDVIDLSSTDLELTYQTAQALSATGPWLITSITAAAALAGIWGLTRLVNRKLPRLLTDYETQTP